MIDFSTAANLFKAADAAQQKFLTAKKNSFAAYVIADSRKDPLPMGHFDAKLAALKADADAKNAAFGEMAMTMGQADLIEFFVKVAA